jgi:hypothetical protein
MALVLVTFVDESIVKGKDIRCWLSFLLDELRLLASGIVWE